MQMQKNEVKKWWLKEARRRIRYVAEGTYFGVLYGRVWWEVFGAGSPYDSHQTLIQGVFDESALTPWGDMVAVLSSAGMVIMTPVGGRGMMSSPALYAWALVTDWRHTYWTPVVFPSSEVEPVAKRVSEFFALSRAWDGIFSGDFYTFPVEVLFTDTAPGAATFWRYTKYGGGHSWRPVVWPSQIWQAILQLLITDERIVQGHLNAIRLSEDVISLERVIEKAGLKNDTAEYFKKIVESKIDIAAHFGEIRADNLFVGQGQQYLPSANAISMSVFRLANHCVGAECKDCLPTPPLFLWEVDEEEGVATILHIGSSWDHVTVFSTDHESITLKPGWWLLHHPLPSDDGVVD